MLPLPDGLPARRFPVVTVALIAANLALVLVFVVQIPAWVYLGGWFVYQVIEARYALSAPAAEGSGVAFFAHIGGFVVGWIVARALLDTRRILPQSTARPSAPVPL
jgi:membrane associated rhomboid family serine protease